MKFKEKVQALQPLIEAELKKSNLDQAELLNKVLRSNPGKEWPPGIERSSDIIKKVLMQMSKEGYVQILYSGVVILLSTERV